ncbi:MAG: hypothetical protein HOO92_05955 [Methylococcaceae bacterium]|nr:hypothetical protein [Methylococcaceae bacterium]
MMKIVSAVCASSLCFIGIAHADMNRYKACISQIAGGPLVASQADPLAGVMTYETYRVFGGGDKEKPVHDQIQKICTQHLDDADKVSLIQQVGEVLGQRNRSSKVNPEQFQANSMVALSAVMAAGKSVQRTINKGQSVGTSYVDSMNVQFLEVLKNTVDGVASAFLVFQQTSDDPTSQLCTQDPTLGMTCVYTRRTYDMASGDVAGNDLTVGGTTAHLTTDITNSANWYFSRCVVDNLTGSMTCTNTPTTGLFDVTFAKTSKNYNKYNGVVETKTGPQIVRTSGNQQQYSANSAGTLLGWIVGANSDAAFGLSTTVTDIITTQ